VLIGIDPGISGALVLLGKDGQPVEWELMPVLKVGKSSRVNAAALAAMLEKWHRGIACSAAHAYVEQVGAMPGQGVTSMFSFGHAVGSLMGAVAGVGVPHTLITPKSWKTGAGLIGTEKDAARARAIQLWPQWRALDKKGEGQALADAALIARFGGAA
jgi:crossover junction endodeoxyribonuclease RuvC